MNPPRGTEAAQPHPMMLEIKGEQLLLNQRLESSISAMNQSLSALQGEMQGVKAKLDQLTHAQADFTHHSTGLERLGAALEKFIEASERRWMAHEAENRLVADAVNSHRTGIKVSWAVFGLFVIVLGALGSSQMSRVKDRMDDHLASGAETKRNYEARFQRNEADIRDIRADMKALKTP